MEGHTVQTRPASASQETTTPACGPQDSGGSCFLGGGHVAVMVGVWSLWRILLPFMLSPPGPTAGLTRNSPDSCSGICLGALTQPVPCTSRTFYFLPCGLLEQMDTECWAPLKKALLQPHGTCQPTPNLPTCPPSCPSPRSGPRLPAPVASALPSPAGLSPPTIIADRAGPTTTCLPCLLGGCSV